MAEHKVTTVLVTVPVEVALDAEVQERSGVGWVAWQPSLDVIGSGRNREEALDKLGRSIRAWFEIMRHERIAVGSTKPIERWSGGVFSQEPPDWAE